MSTVSNITSQFLSLHGFLKAVPRLRKSVKVEKEDIKQLRLISSAAVKMAEKKLSVIGELHDELEKIYDENSVIVLIAIKELLILDEC